MSSGTTTGTPAAWYQDPADASKLRWWDGAAWTAKVANRPPVVPDPPTYNQEPAHRPVVEIPRLPERRGWSPPPLQTRLTKRGAQTVSSWLLATAILWIGFPADFVRSLVAQLDPLIAPIASLADLLVIIAIEIWLARLDGRRLSSQNYRPTGPLWALLPPVYFIIRTVRVGVRGIAVLVLFFASNAVAVLIVLAELRQYI